jgi:hypothetical protein
VKIDPVVRPLETHVEHHRSHFSSTRSSQSSGMVALRESWRLIMIWVLSTRTSVRLRRTTSATTAASSTMGRERKDMVSNSPGRMRGPCCVSAVVQLEC